MKNIINLVRYQLNTLVSTSKQSIILLIFAIVAPFLNYMFLPWSGMVIIFAGIMNSMSYEYRSGIDYLISYLPVKSKEFIISRYVTTGLHFVISIIITVSLYTIINLLNIYVDLPSLGSILIVLAVGSAIIATLIVPVMTLVGPEKGRLFTTFIFVIPMVVGMTAFDNPQIMNFIYKILELDKLIVCIGIFMIIILLFICSYYISIYFYSKKEMK